MRYKLALIHSSNLFIDHSDKVIMTNIYEAYREVNIDVDTYYSGDFFSIEQFNQIIDNYSAVQIICHGDKYGQIHLDFINKKTYTFAEFFSSGVTFNNQILIMNTCLSGKIEHIHDISINNQSIMIGYPNELDYNNISLTVLRYSHRDLANFFGQFGNINDYKLNKEMFKILMSDGVIFNFFDEHHDAILKNNFRTNSDQLGFTFITTEGSDYPKSFYISFRASDSIQNN
jgi:hypothetical protein